MPEAAVVNSDDVVRACISEGVVRVRPPALSDMPSILGELDGFPRTGSTAEENHSRHGLDEVSFEHPTKRELGISYDRRRLLRQDRPLTTGRPRSSSHSHRGQAPAMRRQLPRVGHRAAGGEHAKHIWSRRLAWAV